MNSKITYESVTNEETLLRNKWRRIRDCQSTPYLNGKVRKTPISDLILIRCNGYCVCHIRIMNNWILKSNPYESSHFFTEERWIVTMPSPLTPSKRSNTSFRSENMCLKGEGNRIRSFFSPFVKMFSVIEGNLFSWSSILTLLNFTLYCNWIQMTSRLSLIVLIRNNSILIIF